MSIDGFESPRSAPNPLHEPIASLLDVMPTASTLPSGLERRVRDRLRGRVARALQAGSQLHTLRLDRMAVEAVAPGVALRQLYASRAAVLRPGEPAAAVILEMAPGSSWTMPCADRECREWLLLRGHASIGGSELGTLGFLRESAAELQVSSAAGAQIYLRRTPGARQADRPVRHDGIGTWLPYGPGIVRQLLWTDGHQAAMLYHTVAGATVPHHGHRSDEECLMVEGDLFLDDVLLQPGDYQLAPAGTEHREVSTDTGCLLFARGDLDLALVSG